MEAEAEAEAEGISQGSYYRIRRWDTSAKAEAAEVALRFTTSASLLTSLEYRFFNRTYMMDLCLINENGRLVTLRWSEVTVQWLEVAMVRGHSAVVRGHNGQRSQWSEV